MASQPKYPVYIVSKGRFKNPMTAIYFEETGVDYLIAVEPQEKEEYEKKLGGNRVLCLPFSNLGLGSFPARNFCWEHAKNNGFKKYWCFDDNIRCFSRWTNGKRNRTNEALKAITYIERFSDKNNIDICGFEYRYFSAKPPTTAFKVNCKVYSAMLINTQIPYRWRLKYNEDVDLCLQVLHNGGKTACCVYYLTDKITTTAKMKGGNQDELYKGNDPKKKLLKAKMLEAQWPQYAKTVIRFNRFHHFVDWKVFKNNGINSRLNLES